MKRCLILGVFLALATSAIAAQGSPPPQQQVADAKPVALQVVKQAQAPAPVRHLSEQERAELRRQLQQFNQQNIRRQ